MTTLRERLSRPAMNWTMFSEFHHGDCEGADEQAHDMMRVLLTRHWPLRVDIVIHPPKDEHHRAHCDATMLREELAMVRVLPPKGYLERDRDIVNDTELLIATPKGYTFQGKGGTNYTIRYALTHNKPVLVIWPDGSAQRGVDIDQGTWTPMPMGERKKRERG